MFIISLLWSLTWLLYITSSHSQTSEWIILELDKYNEKWHPRPTTIITYKHSNVGCETIDKSPNEECKYYGECCGDPVRIRERLEPGTYQCLNIGDVQGKS